MVSRDINVAVKLKGGRNGLLDGDGQDVFVVSHRERKVFIGTIMKMDTTGLFVIENKVACFRHSRENEGFAVQANVLKRIEETVF